jgi:hypothetical protein
MPHSYIFGAKDIYSALMKKMLVIVQMMALCIIVGLISTTNLFSQTVFQKIVTAFTYNQYRTNDGGFICTGSQGCISPGGFDASLTKVDSSYNVQWSARFGTAGSNHAGQPIQTSDNGYIMAGRSSGNVSQELVSIIKVDSIGQLQWVKGFIYDQPNSAFSNQLIATSDGGYIIVEASQIRMNQGRSDVFVIKVNSAGQMEWNKVYGEDYGQNGVRIIEASSGGYYIGGNTENVASNNSDVLLLKINAFGALQWSKRYRGPGELVLSDMELTSDGAFMVSGTSDITGGLNDDFFLMKINVSGTVQWSKVYKHEGKDVASSVVQTLDQGYALVGEVGIYIPVSILMLS